MNTPKLTAWVNATTYRAPSDKLYNTQPICSSYTTSVEVKVSRLWWQDKGLSFTSSGYGKRIPTEYMVKFNGKWRRVYCCIYSNSGTLYIGKLPEVGERLYIRIDAE